MGFSPGFGGDIGPPTGLPGDIGSPGGGDWLSALVQDIYSILIAVANFLWAVIKALIGILIKLFQSLAKFLKHIWENYVKAAIVWLASHVQKLYDWLHRHLKKAIAFLQKLKKWYDTHILPQQKRMLAMIQDVRRFLGILRLFHVKWAAKLDASLADLQNRIEESINFVRGTLNQIINTLAIAFDPTMLITSNVLGASLLSNLGAVKRIFSYSFHGPLTAAETTFVDTNVGRYQKSTSNGHVAALASSGLTPYDQSERADSRKAISDATAAPPVI